MDIEPLQISLDDALMLSTDFTMLVMQLKTPNYMRDQSTGIYQ